MISKNVGITKDMEEFAKALSEYILRVMKRFNGLPFVFPEDLNRVCRRELKEIFNKEE